jgi:hypothetical protein
VDELTSDQIFQLALVAIGAIATIVASLAGALAGALYQGRLSRPRMRVKATWSFAVIGGRTGPPQLDAQNRAVNYQEYDVNPLKPGVDRGQERLVVGSDGSAYFTSDHYKSFVKIR